MTELRGPDPAAYNYAVFPPDSDGEDFANFVTHLPVGQTAPDFEAVLLEDESRLRLSDYWRRGICVLEFGSIT